MKTNQIFGLVFSLISACTLEVKGTNTFPEVILLPESWGPEGIATGPGTEFYAGGRHLSPFAGAIYKGDLRTGEGDILVPPRPGRAALGLKVDPRTDLLFVAGGPTGAAFIYDATTGEDVADFQFASPPTTFINDVVLTRTAAYFTDSLNPFIYVVPLGLDGNLPANPTFFALPLSGDFQMASGFNANGIAATPNGQSLIIVQSATGLLYQVDAATGEAQLIDLGGDVLTNGDGVLLDGRTLYVVRNQLNRIAVVALDPSLTSGEYIGDITSPEFRVPTTIAEYGNALYAVNARFGTDIPGTEYQIVRVSK